MGEVRALPVDSSRQVEHRTLSVETLGKLLAQAEELGYRRALIDARVPQAEALRLRSAHDALYNTRCDLYEAIWRRAGKGI